VFPKTIWNGLLSVKGFPKYIYVTTIDSHITVFSMSRIYCVVTISAVRCCCHFSWVLGPRYWFYWELPRIFERWPCCGDGRHAGWGIRIVAVI